MVSPKIMFFGAEMSQNANMPIVLNDFLKRTLPRTIIELGTFKGGLSVLFQIHSLSYKNKFVTYDIKDFVTNINLFTQLNIDRRISDVFSEQTIQEIISLIKSEGRTVLFCDGGNKIKEFNLFAKYLKKGDYILAHDKQTFEDKIKDKIWNWCEITDNDINSVCKEQGIEKMFLEFENVACTCRVKK